MAWIRCTGNTGGSLKVRTASGVIASFETNMADVLQEVKGEINATGGNGTPDNPNPINGYTEANITANGDTITITFGQTVYGGVLDVTRGKLHVTHGIIDLGYLAWNKDYYSSTQKYYYYASPISGAAGYSGWTEVGNIKCDSYPTVSRRDVLTGNLGITLSASVNGGTPNIYNPDFDNAETTENDVKTAMNGVMLVYELATPFDIDLTPEVISAVVGTNNVYSDTNGNTTVKFKDSIQHYIDTHTGG